MKVQEMRMKPINRKGKIQFRFILAFMLLFFGTVFASEGEKGDSDDRADKDALVGKRYALLVGVNDYADSSIVKLTTPRNDASDIGRALIDSGWDKVIVLTDDVDYRNPDFPNRTNIENRVSLLADLVKPQDTIFVFFSGHGVTKDKESLLLPVDAALTRVDETAITLSSIASAFNARGLKKLVIAVDACREQVSTTKGLSVVGVSGGASGMAPNAAALTMYATKAGWYSYEDTNGRNGVFTKFILEGLSGRADGAAIDGTANGVVTFSELASWLPDATATYALDRGIRQQAVISQGTGDRSVLGVTVGKSSAVSVKTGAGAPVVPASESSELKPALDSLKLHLTAVLTDSIKDFDKSITSDNEDAADVDEDNEDSESTHYGFSILQVGLFTPLQLCPSDYVIGGIAVGAIQTYNVAVYGIQAAGVVASTGILGGMQTGIICTSGEVYGIQCGGLVNTAANVYGGQFGFINTAASVYGVQMGFINTAHDLHGVQFGFINTLAKSGMFGKFMFGINIGW
jgi:hypothetical protein